MTADKDDPAGATHRFVYEDTRYFGRFTLDTSSVEALGLSQSRLAINAAVDKM